MALTIDLSPEMERQLRDAAARNGVAPEDFARTAVEEKLSASSVTQAERNQELVELLRQWREEPIDWDEVEGYPEQIEPLRLREIKIDIE